MTIRLAAIVFAFRILLGLCTAEAHEPPTPQAANDLYAKGDWAAAAQAYDRLTKQDATRGLYWYRLAACQLALKEYRPAVTTFETALAHGAQEGATRFQLARAQCRLGEKDAALANLEKSVTAGFAKARNTSAEPDLAALAKEPRFQALLEKLQHPTKGIKGADAFDHWIGEWDVYVNGQRVGGNRIVKALDGFAVEEFWDGGNGGRGRSLFVFDASKGRWKQLWTSDSGWVVEKVGTPIEKGIYLEGTSSFANGTVKKSREYLTRNPDGTVRQLLEDWDEDTKSWKPAFDGKYVVKKAESPAAKK